MQHNCVGIGTLPSFDFTSSFLLQTDPHLYGFSFSSLDMVAGPYNCNGSSPVMSPMPVGAAEESRARRSNDERKKRRLASNRESARRSRVRKQRRLGELSAQVAELRGTNQTLLVQLNQMMAKQARMDRENAELREEASDLRKRLSEMEVEEAEGATSTPKVA